MFYDCVGTFKMWKVKVLYTAWERDISFPPRMRRLYVETTMPTSGTDAPDCNYIVAETKGETS